MFEQFGNFLSSLFNGFSCFKVLYPYERGLVMRFGKPVRPAEPGLNLHIPFGIEEVIYDNIVARELELGTQSLTSLDGFSIAITAIVTIIIEDIEKALLDVEDIDDTTENACQGAVGAMIQANSWENLLGAGLNDEIQSLCNEELADYGVKITKVRVKELVKARTIRLLNKDW